MAPSGIRIAILREAAPHTSCQVPPTKEETVVRKGGGALGFGHRGSGWEDRCRGRRGGAPPLPTPIHLILGPFGPAQ